MNLPQLAVRRRVTFLMIFVAMLGIGVFGVLNLGVDFYPEIQLPTVMVITTMRGAGPEEIETLISKVIESAVSTVEDVETINSVSSSGTSVVTVEFSSTADMNESEDRIREVLDEVESQLPSEALDPYIFALASDNAPILELSFSSNCMSMTDLRWTVEEEIVPIIARTQGVGHISTRGGFVRQIRVDVNPVLLSKYGLTMIDVEQLLSTFRTDTPAGDLETGGLSLTLKIESGFHSVDQIRNTVVGQCAGGENILLGDIAHVYDGHEERETYTRLDGQPTIFCVVRKGPGTNTTEVCDNVERTLEQIDSSYDGQIEIQVVNSFGDFIRRSMSNLFTIGILAIVAAALILFIFLRSWVGSVIISLSMPLSITATFAAMYFVGVNLNFISLAGLGLSIGMIVDNSIVVLENIHRLRECKLNLVESSIQGATEVGMAITASTLTTIAVFIPILLLPGIVGLLFRDMSLTVSFSLAVSLFVALTLIPLFSSRIKELRTEKKTGAGNILDRAFKSLERNYSLLVEWATGHRLSVLLIAAVVFIVSLFMLGFVPTEFMPTAEEGRMEISISRAIGTTLESTDSTARIVEDAILSAIEPADLKHIYTTLGRNTGTAALFGGTTATNEIEVRPFFSNSEHRSKGMQEYELLLREILKGIPGINVEFNAGDPLGGGWPIEIDIFGNDLDDLRQTAGIVMSEMKDISGVVDLHSTLEEEIVQIAFVPNDVTLRLQNLSRADLAGELQLCLLGSNPSILYEAGREIDIHIRIDSSFITSREEILGLTILGAPLDAWGNFENRLIPKAIKRENQSRLATVRCGIQGRSLGSVSSDVEKMLDTLDLGDHRIALGGEAAEQKESFSGMIIAILVAGFLVYMVMASQFESFLEPFIIIFLVPFAFIGVIWALLITGTTLTVTALIGVLMLIGIVVNNGIVLVDYANKQRKKGVNATEAVILAAKVRMRPILMTAMTTIFAMLPLALGTGESGGMWAPMARVVSGGLIVSTALSLVVLPVLYSLFGRWKKVRT